MLAGEGAGDRALSLLAYIRVKPRGPAADRGVVTVSLPVRIVALVGLLVAVAGGGMLALRARHASTATPSRPATVAHTTPAATTPSAHVTPATPATPVRHPALQLDPSLPPQVRQALEHSRRGVVLVYSPASATDRALLQQVRAGARDAHVPFVGLDVSRNSVAAAVFGWTSSAAEPETLVVSRPGKIAFQLEGTTDRQAIAQAAVSSR
jgi:hypothetical protein